MSKTITLTNEQADEIFHKLKVEGFEFVERLDWEDDGKYSYGGVIFKHNDLFYMMSVSRCGSYSTDYEYDYNLNCSQVEKKAVTTEQWRYV